MKKNSALTKEEKSWILYDVGNSAFTLVIITAIMPIFFKDVASAGVPAEVSTANWGIANSVASLALAFIAPLLGSLADYGKLKMKFFVFFLVMGIIFNCLLCLVGEGEWALCLWLYIFARVGWAGANLFYDSFIVDATTRERVDRVSSHGFAWGYIGSVAPFLAIIGLIMFGGDIGIPTPAIRTKIGFIIVAVWWLIFSFPIILNVRQRYSPASSSRSVSASLKNLVRTFREIKKYKRVFTFLLAYFFYIDGVDTIISMSAVYGRDLGLDVSVLIFAILFIQIIAFPSALLYGRLALIFSAKTMLKVGISVYGVIAFIAFLLPSFSEEIKIAAFWFLAFLTGSSMGGVQALSRSYFAKLIPPERGAEFFGFYNIFGKFSIIIGPLLMGVVGRLAGNSRWGILSIFILFVLGVWILNKTDD